MGQRSTHLQPRLKASLFTESATYRSGVVCLLLQALLACRVQGLVSKRTCVHGEHSEWMHDMCVIVIPSSTIQQWQWHDRTHSNMGECPTEVLCMESSKTHEMNSSAQNCTTRWQNDEEMQVITLKSGDGSLWRARDVRSGSIPGMSGELMRFHFLTSVVTVQYLFYTNALSCTKLFYVPFYCGIK